MSQSRFSFYIAQWAGQYGQNIMAVLASVRITIFLNTFDSRTIKHIKAAPMVRLIVMGVSIILILITLNLVIGVVWGTIIHDVIYFFRKDVDIHA